MLRLRTSGGTRRAIVLAAATALGAGLVAAPSAAAAPSRDRPVPRTPSDTAPAAGALAAGTPMLSARGSVLARKTSVRRIRVDLVLATAPGGRRDATTIADLAAGVRNVDAFYDRNTGGRIRFTVGRTKSWTRTSNACSIGVPRSLASRLRWSERRNRILVAYQPQSCYFAGVGELPGHFVLLARYAGTTSMAHEIGHNLGLSHSNLSRCSLAFSKVCSESADTRKSVEYGDATDLMGGGESQGLAGRFAVRAVDGTLNPRQLALLGVPFARTRISLTRSTPQSITLRARIDRLGWSAATLVWGRRTFWLSYLAGTGVDDPLAGDAFATRPFHGQVVVQTKIGQRSLLVAPSRSTSAGPGLPDWTLTSLPGGRTLQVRAQGTSAVITVTPPDPARPTSVTVRPGSASLAVSWKRASTTGLTGYVVEAHAGSTVLTRTVTVGSTSTEITGVRAGQPYRVRVYPLRGSVRGTPAQSTSSVAPLPAAVDIPAAARVQVPPDDPWIWQVVVDPPASGWGVVRSLTVVVRNLSEPSSFADEQSVTTFGDGPVVVDQWWGGSGPFRVSYTVTYRDGGTYTALVAASYTAPA